LCIYDYFNAIFCAKNETAHKCRLLTLRNFDDKLHVVYAYCRKFDIVDSMLQKLEKYADNLENIVQQRTAELVDEKRKTDMLLHRMLPPYAFTIICHNR